MNVGVYFCRCGSGSDGQVSAKIDPDIVRARIEALPDVGYLEVVDFACSDAGQEQMGAHLRQYRPDRVVVAACSPRQHEETFRGVLSRAGMNPYLMHLVNIREQVAWVTEEPVEAAAKAVAQIGAGVARVVRHRPLHPSELDVCAEVLVIGGGPAGLKAALTLAEAGRSVTLVERAPILGGLPVRFEEIFPSMECAPCLLEPILGEVLHGGLPGSIDIHLTSTVTAAKGYLGNFDVRIVTAPRHVSLPKCVGCGVCVDECPVSVPNPLNLNRTSRKAIDFELFGGLPSAPVLDEAACSRFTEASDCTACRDACPVDGAVLFDETERVTEKKVGAIVVAIGADQYDLSRLPALGYGRHPDVLSGWDLERMLAANGPTGGELRTSRGDPPRSIAIIHCAGSLDPDNVPYCSAICCQGAFKYAHLIGNKLPDAKVLSFFRTIAVPGKEAFTAYRHMQDNPNASLIRYDTPDQIEVRAGGDPPLAVAHRKAGGETDVSGVDMVVLLAPVVPAPGARGLARALDLTLDSAGFLEAHNARSDATRSTVRGVSIAGACQSPMDIASAMTQGTAAAGYALAVLAEGRKLHVEPITAAIDAERCSGCRTCVPVCPYRAIDFDPQTRTASVNSALCAGCGTCVAACPIGAITGHHFTDDAILAEIEAVLRP